MGIKEQAIEKTGKFLRSCVDNNGMFLFATAAAGWALASLAQTVGLITNKDIGKEEKKFLVPQEIMNGTFNIATYAAVTIPIMGAASKIAQKKFPNSKQAVEGAKTLAAIAGGVISSNIITPILRNKSSVVIKKIMEEKNLTPPPPEIYDGKTAPYFRAKQPLTMKNYINFTKISPYSGNLKI